MKDNRRRRGDPTLAEIRHRCLQIQRGWDEQPRAARLGVTIDVHWSLPVVGGPAKADLEEIEADEP